jgi:hypothetical protein
MVIVYVHLEDPDPGGVQRGCLTLATDEFSQDKGTEADPDRHKGVVATVAARRLDSPTIRGAAIVA